MELTTFEIQVSGNAALCPEKPRQTLSRGGQRQGRTRFQNRVRRPEVGSTGGSSSHRALGLSAAKKDSSSSAAGDQQSYVVVLFIRAELPHIVNKA